MKARLTVRLEDSDFFEIKAAARMRGQSVAQWLSQALRAALDRDRPVVAKLEAIRRAVKHSAPTCDIEQMLKEIGSS